MLLTWQESPLLLFQVVILVRPLILFLMCPAAPLTALSPSSGCGESAETSFLVSDHLLLFKSSVLESSLRSSPLS